MRVRLKADTTRVVRLDDRRLIQPHAQNLPRLELDVLVRGPEGARANWRVEASPATELDDPTWTQETNSLGRASFAALAPGRWHVRVAAAGDDPGEVFAQEQIVDVALDQPNDVVFRVD